MGIDIEETSVTKKIRVRCRRIEIIADTDEFGNLVDGTQKYLREYEKQTIVNGRVEKREFDHNHISAASDMLDLVDPWGTSGLQVLRAMMWSNDLPQYIDPPPPVVEEVTDGEPMSLPEEPPADAPTTPETPA